MGHKFQRKIEDFACANCGAKVKGNGYTNHCPRCFYSRHVDNQPGDRANNCGGLMAPAAARPYRGGWRVAHICQKCGQRRENRLAETDDLGKLAKILAK